MFFVLLTFVLVFSVFHVLYGNNPPKSIYIISVILLILVGGFRYFVGIFVWEIYLINKECVSKLTTTPW